jgi:hypothetical protein
MGFVLAEYYSEKGLWRKERTQTKGALNLAVNSEGMPAICVDAFPRNIYVKSRAGNWDMIKACAHKIAYGKDDVLYRIGCDRYLYVHR